MIWLTWRQHRRQALFGIIGFAVLAAVLVPSGRAMRSAFASSGAKACLDKLGTAHLISMDVYDGCESSVGIFSDTHENWAFGAALLVFLPMLVGMFWGAPLVAREVESGTHRLVWTQDVSRTRWFLVKFGLIGGAVLLLAGGYAALMTWWLDPLTRTLVVPLGYLIFDLHGVVPVAYTLFAVALGTFAGAVTRKVLPAMGATFVVFLAVRAVTEFFVRPKLRGVQEYRIPTSAAEPLVPNPATRDWILDSAVHNADGSVRQADATGFCRPGGPPPDGGPAPSVPPRTDTGPCGDAGTYNLWTYQPAGRFTLFQAVESGIFVVLAIALVAGTVLLVRRRIS
jgi:hypothetical protein